MEKELRYKDYSISYEILGTGNRILLAFHGFGQTKAHLKPLEKSLGKDYTIYTIDLFFHGKSKWKNEEPFLSKKLWQELIGLLIKGEQINNFSLLGYSMGGKFVLATIERFASHVERVILIAPDGIKTNIWYSLATYPFWIRGLFKKSIERPGIFKGFVRVLRSVRLVDKSLLKFAETQMDTYEKRAQVYNSWVVFRMLKFDMDRMARLINQQKIQVEVFLGRFDKMITENNLRNFMKKLNHCQVKVLETGHNKLISEVADYYNKNK